ncbi:MAG: NAD(P)H-hydrate epimerase, partial [Deltaproteobacteria bacterium]|nr:NAD(P)H-hydrate epimerase [Deltaproteobacteria bacterium]
MYLVTAAEMRELDRLTSEKYGTPGHVLMERAGVGATEVLLKEFPHVRKGSVLVLAGKGNNGGDGLVIARHLRKRGVRCEVILAANKEEVKGDALRNLTAFLRLRGRVTEVTEAAQLGVVQDKLSRCGLIVDALLGTGLNSPVRGLLAMLIDLMNASPWPVLAVDIPSGLDADHGVPLGTAVQAQVTATFAFPKIGQVIYPGAEYVGELVVVDIGIAAEALSDVRPQTELLLAAEVGGLVHKRSPDSHKGDFGHVLVIAGARGKTGAALLCCRAAMRAGAGLVTLGSPASLNPVLASAVLEVMTVPLADSGEGSLRFDNGEELSRVLVGKGAVVLGPGIGVSSDTIALTRWLVIHCELPLVVDADGLNCLAEGLEVLQEC